MVLYKKSWEMIEPTMNNLLSDREFLFVYCELSIGYFKIIGWR